MRKLMIVLGLIVIFLTAASTIGFAEIVEVNSEWGYYLPRGNYGVYAGVNAPQDQVPGYVFIGQSNPMYERFGRLLDSRNIVASGYDAIWGPKLLGGMTDPYGQHFYLVTPNQIRNAATGAPINGVIYVQQRKGKTGAGGNTK
jgi:hypothetical protein